MLDSFFEKQASRSKPRFKYFIDARELYNNYVNGNAISFDEITESQQAAAAASPTIRQAENLFSQATLLAAKYGAVQDVAAGLYQLGVLSYLQGRYADAVALLEQGLKIYKSLPGVSPESISNSWFFLGLTAIKQGDPEKARFFLEQVVEIDTRSSNLRNLQYSQRVLQKCETEPAEILGRILGEQPSIFDQFPFLRNVLKEISAVENAPINAPAASNSVVAHNAPGDHSEAIWIFSYSEKIASDFMDSLDGLANQVSTRVSLIPAAFEEHIGTKYVPPVLDRDESLCAAVFLLEKGGMEDKNTRNWLDWCIHKVIQQNDFRLFVILANMTLDELNKYTVEGALPDSLQDTVQLIPSLDSLQLRDVLARYLFDLNEIRKRSAARKIRSAAISFAGSVAGFVQVTCAFLLGFAVLASLVMGEAKIVSWLNNYDIGLVATIAAIPFFSTILIPLHLLLKGPVQLSATISTNEHLRWWLLPLFVLAPAAIGLPLTLNAPIPWITLGIILGLLMEISRRNRAQDRKTRLSLQKAFNMSTTFESAQATKAMLRSNWNPWNYPLTNVAKPRVFISYTRRSAWSKSVATKLEQSLRLRNIQSFRDESGIESGSQWRNQLSQNLNNCNIFISILDEVAVQSEWVASEMIIALTSQSMTGLPDIFILGGPQLSGKAKLPVFSTLYDLHETARKKNKVRFISVDEDMVETFASGLVFHARSTPSILPSRFTALFKVLLLPLQWIGPLGLLPGLLSLPVAYFQFIGLFDLEGILQTRNLFVPSVLVCGYWIGYMLRLSFASRFEIRQLNRQGVANVHLASGVGFFLIIVHWWEQSLSLLIGWSLALCWLGWMLAGELINRSNRDSINSKD